jgi:hypothetical protein
MPSRTESSAWRSGLNHERPIAVNSEKSAKSCARACQFGVAVEMASQKRHSARVAAGQRVVIATLCPAENRACATADATSPLPRTRIVSIVGGSYQVFPERKHLCTPLLCKAERAGFAAMKGAHQLFFSARLLVRIALYIPRNLIPFLRAIMNLAIRRRT